MKVGELKKWPKVYDLYKSYCEEGYSDDEEVGEHFCWDSTEEGYLLWALLDEGSFEDVENLHPNLFEAEEGVPEEDLQEEKYEWIEWKGGPVAPVSDNTEVEIKHND